MNIDHHADIGLKGHYQFIRATEEDIARAYVLDSVVENIGMLEALTFVRQATPRFVKWWLNYLKRYGLPQFATVEEYDNLVPNVLKYSLATLLSGTTVAPTFKIKYFALGTGATAPAATDTQLQTETVRAAVQQALAINNVAYLNSYFSNAQVGGLTFLECGMIVDGSASANTGSLLSHAAISQAIGSNQTLTVNATMTIS